MDDNIGNFDNLAKGDSPHTEPTITFSFVRKTPTGHSDAGQINSLTDLDELGEQDSLLLLSVMMSGPNGWIDQETEDKIAQNDPSLRTMLMNSETTDKSVLILNTARQTPITIENELISQNLPPTRDLNTASMNDIQGCTNYLLGLCVKHGVITANQAKIAGISEDNNLTSEASLSNDESAPH